MGKQGLIKTPKIRLKEALMWLYRASTRVCQALFTHPYRR